MLKIRQHLTQLAIESGGYGQRVPMAAGIVYKRHLIATGVNQPKTHPLMLTDGYREDQRYRHAEVDAIRNALRLISKEQLKQCELHIVRVKRPHIASKKWVYGLAKPCTGCANVIKRYGIGQVFWTADESKILDLV
jgi:tRNA(Arg) A34 adenosine deaminase TadA